MPPDVWVEGSRSAPQYRTVSRIRLRRTSSSLPGRFSWALVTQPSRYSPLYFPAKNKLTFHHAPRQTFCSSNLSLLTAFQPCHPSSESQPSLKEELNFDFHRKPFPFILPFKDRLLCLCQQTEHVDLHCLPGSSLPLQNMPFEGIDCFTLLTFKKQKTQEELCTSPLPA